MGDLGSIPGLGRSPGEEKGYPLQYSGLVNSMDSMVAKSWTGLSDFHFPFFLVSVAGSLLILLIFSKNKLSVFSLFIYFFLFSNTLTSALYFFCLLSVSLLSFCFFVLVFFNLYGIVFFLKIH